MAPSSKSEDIILINEIYISVYDLEDYTDDGYEAIGIFRAESYDSTTFTEITTSATRLELSDTEEYYYYSDETATASNNVYKVKYYDASGTPTSFITDYFYPNTSDLTEKLRYMIEDITTPNRYSIKELRRFINMAISRLQGTIYRRRFNADFNGVIHPQMDKVDEAIILLQAMIILNQSQLTRAADTNMSFKDGRGTINIRTTETLKENIKGWQAELVSMVKDINRLYISPVVVDMLSSSPYYEQYSSGGE